MPPMRSDLLKKGPSRAPARAMLKGAGFNDADLEKPLIGVANTWTEVTPCNMHLRALAEKVKEGIREAGGTPIEFNTIAVSDGISMGTEGMRASLVSREVIADSIELFALGHLLDGVVALSGCDKTIPGTVMALARLDVPSLMLYGGAIAPGRFDGRDVTIQDVFEADGANSAGRMTDADLHRLEVRACPGAGACGGQYTANTMATACAFLGVSPMGANEVPATDPRKADVARACGRALLGMIKSDIRPRSLITRKSLENAIASAAATAGSTNAVLHLLAIAREAGVPLSIDDFDPISARTPVYADLKPGGRFVAVDMYRAGGERLLGQRLREAGLLRDAPTCTGRSLFDEIADFKEDRRGRRCVAACIEALPSSLAAGFGDPARQPRPGGVRPQAGGPRSRASRRPGARLRRRGGGVRGRAGGEGPGRGCRRHPLRGPARGAGHARDAGSDRSDRRSWPR